ncbi:MAG: ABC transporter ATP-binding protein [Selenomonadaceae bacterium]
MDTILAAKNLCFLEKITYPNIDIERNRATFICGESGCGKSTLLKIFNGTVSPSRGEVTYNGASLTALNTVRLRREVLLIAQTVFLFDGTIEDNFRQYYAFREQPLLPANEMKIYLSLCCANFDLLMDCATMSGGERQRVFIAICLSFLPKVVLLDEPTSALDEKTANQFFISICQFCTQNSITLIVVSHDKSLIDRYADNTITLAAPKETII